MTQDLISIVPEVPAALTPRVRYNYANCDLVLAINASLLALKSSSSDVALFLAEELAANYGA
jgi:hypothetical protein